MNLSLLLINKLVVNCVNLFYFSSLSVTYALQWHMLLLNMAKVQKMKSVYVQIIIKVQASDSQSEKSWLKGRVSYSVLFAPISNIRLICTKMSLMLVWSHTKSNKKSSDSVTGKVRCSWTACKLTWYIHSSDSSLGTLVQLLPAAVLLRLLPLSGSKLGNFKC